MDTFRRGGTTCDWGRVLSWEPPSRLVLTWDINADWQYDPTLKTEVEVRFIVEGPNATRVELRSDATRRKARAREQLRR